MTAAVVEICPNGLRKEAIMMMFGTCQVNASGLELGWRQECSNGSGRNRHVFCRAPSELLAPTGELLGRRGRHEGDRDHNGWARMAFDSTLSLSYHIEAPKPARVGVACPGLLGPVGSVEELGYRRQAGLFRSKLRGQQPGFSLSYLRSPGRTGLDAPSRKTAEGSAGWQIE